MDIQFNERHHRHINNELRAAAVERVLMHNDKLAVVARRYGVGESTVHRWVSKARKLSWTGTKAADPKQLSAAEALEQEIRELDNQIAALTEKRDVLVQAKTYLTDKK